MPTKPVRPVVPVAPEVTQGERYDFLYSNSTTLAAGASGQLEIKTQQDSIFIVQTMMAVRTGRFTARFLDDGSGNNWNNQPILDLDIFGSAQRPNIMIDPIVVWPTSSILISLANLTAAPNSIEIALGGYKIFREMERPARRSDLWFQYGGTVTLGANQRDTFTIKLQADSHFLVKKIVGFGRNAALAAANFSARISDTSLGKAWSDRFIQRDNQIGSAEFPRVLPFPKLLRPNTTVQVEALDLSGAANTVEVVLEGVKQYER
jgi:hypothetical protein